MARIASLSLSASAKSILDLLDSRWLGG